jgi:hypothetical protein
MSKSAKDRTMNATPIEAIGATESAMDIANMATIGIEWICGRPITGAEQDEGRAEEAACAVFAKAGVNPAEAQREFERQWALLDDYAGMTGLALVWIQAESAANIAATEGWHNPEGGQVTIQC